MYYGKMSKSEILNSSRKFLFAIYQNYVNRACENLGVSPDNKKEGETKLRESDYPSEFISFSQAEREKMINESNESDDDFLKKFPKVKM